MRERRRSGASSRLAGLPAPAWVFAAWLLLSLATVAAAWPHIDTLGLYYDEAFGAQQAREFVEPERAGVHPASVRTTWLFGRPFPLRNAAYLGALKSHLLMPALAVAGTSTRVVRAATLATGLLALLLSMLWAQRCFGLSVSLIGGLLVASDPCFHFFSQFEWGPFTTNFLCRAAGLLLAVHAWQGTRPRRALLAAAGSGLCFGLGVFSRADFVVILAGLAAGVAVARPDLVRQALLGERRLRLGVFAASLFLAALPMLLSVSELLTTSAGIADRGGVAEKARVLWSVLDGSHYYRVLAVGGVFERSFEAPAPAGLFGLVLVACALAFSVDFARRSLRGERAPLDPGIPFLLVTGLVVTAGMLGMPGAVRAHHQLNGMPFLQLLVACAAAAALARGGAARTLARVLLLAVLAGNALVIDRTQDLIERTGGRGRFTRSLHDFAQHVDRQPGASVISLDWGFHEPLLLLTSHTRLEEAIWAVPAALQAGKPWEHEGDSRTLYLVHDEAYDLFGLGPDFLASARALPEGAAEITPYRDREGEVAFWSVRIEGPHRVSYGGRFQIRRRPV